MKIGKYRVTCGAEGNAADGYQGYAVLTWDEGSETREKKLAFDKVLPSEQAAMQHALEQVALRAKNDEL
jgi:hypothetical protein